MYFVNNAVTKERVPCQRAVTRPSSGPDRSPGVADSLQGTLTSSASSITQITMPIEQAERVLLLSLYYVFLVPAATPAVASSLLRPALDPRPEDVLAPGSMNSFGQGVSGAAGSCAALHAIVKQGCTATASSRTGGGACPKIISQDSVSKLGFIVSGIPKSSVKKDCVGTLHMLVHRPTQPLASRYRHFLMCTTLR